MLWGMLKILSKIKGMLYKVSHTLKKSHTEHIVDIFGLWGNIFLACMYSSSLFLK